MKRNFYKEKNMKRIMIAFTKAEHKELRDLAYESGKPLTQYVKHIIVKWMEWK